MIIRCSGCNSAFGVADSKVNNKKFAFSCPKCSTENIIDNKLNTVQVASDSVDKQREVKTIGAEMGSGDRFSGKDQNRHDTSASGTLDIAEDAHDDKMDDFDITISDDMDIPEDEFNAGENIIVDDIDGTSDLSLDIEMDLDKIADIDDFKPMEDEGLKLPEPDFDLDIDLQSEKKDAFSEDDDTITLDLNSLDLDLDEGGDKTATPKEKPLVTSGKTETIDKEDQDDEDITLDMDSLDLDFDEGIDLSESSKEKPLAAAGKMEIADEADEDESITIDLDSLDLDLDEGGDKDSELMEKPLVTSGKMETIDKEVQDDEDITLDLDTLDLDLAEEDKLSTGESYEPDDMEYPDLSGTKKAALDGLEDEEDEKITLDLDTLDLELVEDETLKAGETPDNVNIEESIMHLDIQGSGDEEEDESITLDLDTLDIPISETEVNKNGETADEDEKLTLDDAGITFDELTSDEIVNATDPQMNRFDDEEEDIHLTIDEIDPDLDIDELEFDDDTFKGEPRSVPAGFAIKKDDHPGRDLEFDSGVSDLDFEFDKLEKDFKTVESNNFKSDFDMVDDRIHKVKLNLDEAHLADIDMEPFDRDLPDINLDEFDDSKTADVMDFDDREEYFDRGDAGEKYDLVKTGVVSFSIDYTLAYSRLGAFLRLTGLFFIGLIPHFIVLFIYSALSLILGIFNHIVVMLTKRPVDDFHAIQENTLRYFLSLYASSIGIVEEMPEFAGRNNLDYSLQLNITYSLKYSNLFALLRLSVAGILLITLPHIIILSLISAAIPVLFLIGIISVLITGRWPYILFDFLTKYYRSITRLMAFVIGLVDTYPPFKFV